MANDQVISLKALQHLGEQAARDPHAGLFGIHSSQVLKSETGTRGVRKVLMGSAGSA